jgi:acetyl-CoA C-acetyltransferase
MTATPDPDRIPVVLAAGQSIERTETVTPIDLMARACDGIFSEAPPLRNRIERLSVVGIMTRTGPAPASELADRLGIDPTVREVTTAGGNTPQWLVNRAASDIAAGTLSVTLISGAEAIRSGRARHSAGLSPPSDRGAADPEIGDTLPGFGPAESAIGLVAPMHVYPLLESVVAARQGHDAPSHRLAMGKLFAPFSEVAAANPYAWFPHAWSPEEIATPSPENRVVCEPYTKRMSAFLGSDQGAALLVCSLAAAERARLAERAVFVWAGAEATDVRAPSARPDLGRSPGIAAAGAALFEAARVAAGRSVGIDDVELIDLYSCFPSAVELACDALGLASRDDSRLLTVTGGLPYFGGPGNNYTTHSIAALTERLRNLGNGEGGGGGGRLRARLGLTTGLGWYVTKHALGLYGSAPPPGGFRRGDTEQAQTAIDSTAVEVALGVEEATAAETVASTVVRDGDGTPTAAPMIVRLPDGRHMAVAAADGDTVGAVGTLDVPGLVGGRVVVQPHTARYRLATP